MSVLKKQSEQPRCAWLIQSTVRGDTRERLQNACAENGNPFYIIDVIPFSPEMPDEMPDVNGPFVFYGYTTLLLNASQSPRWREGVFFDPNLFRPSVYLQKWGGRRMLNDDAHVLTMREFAQRNAVSAADSWFIKPDDDLKRFTGGVMTYGEYLEWYSGLEDLGVGADIGPETLITVCKPKEVGHEWRIFVVNGKSAASSCYSANNVNFALPPEVEQFALAAATEWSPADAFALDVTIDEAGAPRIIEANCINGSGLYFADTYAFVRALSCCQEITWERSSPTPEC